MINSIPNELLKQLQVVSDNVYHDKACDYLSSSDFKKIYSTSYKDWVYAEEQDPTKSDNMTLGSAIHTVYLEEEKFAEDYAIMPEFVPTDGKEYKNFKNTNNYKEQVNDFMLENGHKEILTKEQADLVQHIKEALEASKWDKLVRNEHSIYENALYTVIDGIKHKAKFDILTIIDGRLSIVDLKSTRATNEAEFKKDFYYLNYDLQAYFYKLVLECFTDLPIDFYFLATRNFMPASVCLYKVSSKSLEGGKEKYLTAYERIVTKDINDGLRAESEIVYL